jgi:hypothetical protein
VTVPTDDSSRDRQTARELALLCRSGVGGTELREAAIAHALSTARAEGYRAAIAAARARHQETQP